MDIQKFCADFEKLFPITRRNKPTRIYSLRLNVNFGFKFTYYIFDPLRDIEGMISVKKQQLLNLAYANLQKDEAYLEVGTWQGKSLISAMRGNTPRPTFACDNFSEYTISKDRRELNIYESLRNNLRRYGVDEHVIFYNDAYQSIFFKDKLPVPVGVYFYDAAHDENSQYLGIKLAEPFLAEKALVIVDDWRFAPDSQSYAAAGTQKAISESKHQWRMLYNLPARYSGDRAMWWNGVAVFAFQRV